jgi:hypothetical protein
MREFVTNDAPRRSEVEMGAAPTPTGPRRLRRSVAVLGVALLGVTGLASCAPPAVIATSPFYGSATQNLDRTWEGNLLACTSGGGVVTVASRGWNDASNPFVVEIFRGWNTDAASLLTTGAIHAFDETVSSPPLPLDTCFHVRIRQQYDRTTAFDYTVTWCSGSCTTVPVAPEIRSFGATGGPFVAPAVVPFGWEVRDRNPDDVLTCRLDADGDGTWDVTVQNCRGTVGRNAGVASAGDHVATLELSDGTHPPVTRTLAYTVAPGPTEPYDIVIRPTAPLDPAVQAAVDQAVARWERVIVRGVPDVAVSVPAGQCGTGGQPFDGTIDDLVVDLVVGPLDGQGGIAGTAGACVFGADRQSRFGLIIIDSADLPHLETTGLLDDLVAHELGHVIGFPGTTFSDFVRDGDSDLPQFVGPRAVLEWSALTGAPQQGVPLHQHDLAHWGNELNGELMAPSLLGGSFVPLSRLTIAAFADMGYHVDLSVADPFALAGSRMPAAAGPADRVVAQK